MQCETTSQNIPCCCCHLAHNGKPNKVRQHLSDVTTRKVIYCTVFPFSLEPLGPRQRKWAALQPTIVVLPRATSHGSACVELVLGDVRWWVQLGMPDAQCVTITTENGSCVELERRHQAQACGGRSPHSHPLQMPPVPTPYWGWCQWHHLWGLRLKCVALAYVLRYR